MEAVSIIAAPALAGGCGVDRLRCAHGGARVPHAGWRPGYDGARGRGSGSGRERGRRHRSAVVDRRRGGRCGSGRGRCGHLPSSVPRHERPRRRRRDPAGARGAPDRSSGRDAAQHRVVPQRGQRGGVHRCLRRPVCSYPEHRPPGVGGRAVHQVLHHLAGVCAHQARVGDGHVRSRDGSGGAHACRGSAARLRRRVRHLAGVGGLLDHDVGQRRLQHRPLRGSRLRRHVGQLAGGRRGRHAVLRPAGLVDDARDLDGRCHPHEHRPGHRSCPATSPTIP